MSHRLTISIVLALSLALGLALPSSAAPGDVLSEAKVSADHGGFAGALSAGDGFGEGATAIGDVDGDGVVDLAVGAPADDDGGAGSGAVWILLMNGDGTVRTERKISRTSGGLSSPLSDGARFGEAMAPLGDLDADGVPDLAVGAEADSLSGTQSGAIFLLYLNRDGTVRSDVRLDYGDLYPRASPLAYRAFGSGLAAIGDLDRDGAVDLAVGAAGDDGGAESAGAVFIVYLRPNGVPHHVERISNGWGGFPDVLPDYERFGTSVAAIGDIDGDGVADLAVGAPFNDDGGWNRGSIWILLLQTHGYAKQVQQISSIQGDFGGTLSNGEYFGTSMASVGDLDGDGRAELAVGSPSRMDANGVVGGVWILSLSPAGAVSDELLISQGIGGFTTPVSLDLFGRAITGIEAFGTDRGGMLVGAPGDDDGGTDFGAFYLLELDGSDLVCGNGTIDPVEECDDANVADGDGCSATCEIETSIQFAGIADSSGLLSLDVDGERLNVSVLAGSRPGDIATLLGVAIDTHPVLTAIGTSAAVSDGRLVTNGVMTDASLPATNAWFSTTPGVVTGEARVGPGTAGFSSVLDASDAFGTAIAAVPDVDGDGIDDLRVGAPGDDDDEPDGGALWYLLMTANDTVKAMQKITFTGGSNIDYSFNAVGFGSALAVMDDLDGNGVREIAVGAPNAFGGGLGYRVGTVQVMFMRPGGVVDYTVTLSDQLAGFGSGLEIGDAFGASVAAIGDVDGDGVGDLAVGAPETDSVVGREGAVYILLMNANGTIKSRQQIAPGVGGFVATLSIDAGFGASLARVGDLDGDGRDEIAIGARRATPNAGQLWILFLAADGTVAAQQQIGFGGAGDLAGVLAEPASFGAAITAIGDIDADGIPDLAVGGPDDDGAGAARGSAWILRLRANGTVKAHQKISEQHGDLDASLGDEDFFGAAIASRGVLDDGTFGLVVGAPGADELGLDKGELWLVDVDGIRAVCGDASVLVPETCDDGNDTSGDGCYSTCRLEDEEQISGVAVGGSIQMILSGSAVLIATFPGQSAVEVVSNLSAIANLTPSIVDQGISSLALDGRLVTDGTIDAIIVNDPGLAVPEPGLGAGLVSGLLLLCGAARRRSGAR